MDPDLDPHCFQSRIHVFKNAYVKTDGYEIIYNFRLIFFYLNLCNSRGEFNNASARGRSLLWYLSLFIMCKA